MPTELLKECSGQLVLAQENRPAHTSLLKLIEHSPSCRAHDCLDSDRRHFLQRFVYTQGPRWTRREPCIYRWPALASARHHVESRSPTPSVFFTDEEDTSSASPDASSSPAEGSRGHDDGYFTVKTYAWPATTEAKRPILSRNERRARHREVQRRFLARKRVRLSGLREIARNYERQLELLHLRRQAWDLELENQSMLATLASLGAASNSCVHVELHADADAHAHAVDQLDSTSVQARVQAGFVDELGCDAGACKAAVDTSLDVNMYTQEEPPLVETVISLATSGLDRSHDPLVDLFDPRPSPLSARPLRKIQRKIRVYTV